MSNYIVYIQIQKKQIFSTVPFEKLYSRELLDAVKLGNDRTVEYLLEVVNKYLIYDFDQVYQRWSYLSAYYI